MNIDHPCSFCTRPGQVHPFEINNGLWQVIIYLHDICKIRMAIALCETIQ